MTRRHQLLAGSTMQPPAIIPGSVVYASTATIDKIQAAREAMRRAEHDGVTIDGEYRIVDDPLQLPVRK